tara:strand:- start:171 stop:629 length:459 start_codon:yes stop_codon:yes gene_type:complete
MNCCKHLIECHCVLPQFRQVKDAPYHQFIVFSILDEGGTVIPKHAKCNNCGVIHNVVDIQKSEVLPGKEEGGVIEKEDIKLMLPESIVNILESYDCEVYNWEHALFITQNKLWDSNIILTRKEENGEAYGKILKFKGPSNYSIEPYNQRLLI